MVDLCEILLESSLGCKVQDDQLRLTRALVLLAPLSTGFEVYLSKFWDPYVSPASTILVFFCGVSVLFQHVDLVTTPLRAGFRVYLS